VSSAGRTRDHANVKSLSIKTNLAQALMLAKVEGQNLKTVGRKLGGVEPEYRAAPASRELLFTKEKFSALPPEQRKILPLLSKPRSAGQLIEGSGIPWSMVLKSMGAFLEKGLIERV
jgi:hypothetical protein